MNSILERAAPLRLLIADDAPDVTEVVSFGARIAWPDCIVHAVANGQAALDYFAHKPADLVVLDVAMPPPDGFEVCRRIREVSQVPILMLTVRDATADKVRALELGADDYLTKPFDHLELLARLRALMRRSLIATMPLHKQLGSDIRMATFEDFSLNFATQEVRVGERRIPLTSTEYRLLEELVRNAGTALSHRQLLERVWGPEYVGETHYLKVFVQRLRQKLNDNPQQARYIHTEWGRGYRFASSFVRERNRP
jgi:DNA-binding response OmpR family regulator